MAVLTYPKQPISKRIAGSFHTTKYTTFLSIALLCMPAAAEVFKCTVNGKVVYADSPCGNQAKSIKMDDAPALPTASQSAAAAAQKFDASKVDQRLAIRAAIASSEPLVGMTREELDMAMGKADRVNSSDYGRGQEDQIIYYRPKRTFYVYIKARIVTTIQSTEGVTSARKDACPGYYEIRDMEVTASRISMRDTDAGRKLEERIAQARACK